MSILILHSMRLKFGERKWHDQGHAAKTYINMYMLYKYKHIYVSINVLISLNIYNIFTAKSYKSVL